MRTSRWWESSEDHAPPADRGPVPRQEPDAVRLLPADERVHAAARRDGLVLHVQGGRQAGDTLLCIARRGGLRNLVDDALRLGRCDPVAALAGGTLTAPRRPRSRVPTSPPGVDR